MQHPHYIYVAAVQLLTTICGSSSSHCLLLIDRCNTCTILQVRLRIWRLQDGLAVDNPVLECSSTSGALEVGGGPWGSTWSAEAAMREPLKSIVMVPLNVEGIVSAIPGKWRPPGL